jgi:hypothetical protein
MKSYRLCLKDNHYGDMGELFTSAIMIKNGLEWHKIHEERDKKSAFDLIYKYKDLKLSAFQSKGITTYTVDDESDENIVFSISETELSKAKINTYNNMGVFRLSDIDEDIELTVEIRSRFDKQNQQYFLVHMLCCIFGGTMTDWIEYAETDMWRFLLVLVYRNRFEEAYAQGVFKRYIRFDHNDTNTAAC